MAKRSGSKLAAFIGALLVAALICGVVYFIYVYTGEFSTDFKTFYVEIDGTKYVKDSGDLLFGDSTRIDVHYTFEKVQSKKLSFTYDLQPVGTDFVFTIDGKSAKWSNVTDLKKAFNVKSDEDGITLDCSSKSVLDILQIIYPNSEIVLPEIDETQSRYKLVVTAEDGRTSISLTFSIFKGITLDKEHITF